ncbi:hypothetical protein, partial [Romboutsia sp.]|uniref:hypothetical protein n=1 Tax=Romboutsia sp. TaxID=1965302 RepID=UPI003F2D3EE9
IDMSVLLSMLYKIYLYSYSNTSRDRLTANACHRFTMSDLHHKYLRNNYISLYDRHSSEYYIYKGSCTFTRDFYTLSSSNRTISSKYCEIAPYIDKIQIDNFNIVKRDIRILDNDFSSIVMTKTTLETAKNNYGEIISYNGYSSIKDDCLIGLTLAICYKDQGGDFLAEMFNRPEAFKYSNLMSLYNSSLRDIEHKNIVFDKTIDEIIDSSVVNLYMEYSSFTKSGGARRTDYKQLKTKKISPVSRRDKLIDIIDNISSQINIKPYKILNKLDVDFKRFY